MYNKINQLPILDVLNRVGIKYQSLGNETIGIIEDGKFTNGWRVNIRDNFINDFSGKNRARGSPYNLVKQYLNLTNYETFQWFKTHFNIENEKGLYHNRGSPKQKKSKVMRPYSRTWLQS